MATRSRTRPLPNSKSLGTAYNLRPRTERVPARSLRVGDVVLESPDTPARISHLTYPNGGWRVTIHARYVWQADTERSWYMGSFDPDHPFDRATPGEY